MLSDRQRNANEDKDITCSFCVSPVVRPWIRPRREMYTKDRNNITPHNKSGFLLGFLESRWFLLSLFIEFLITGQTIQLSSFNMKDECFYQSSFLLSLRTNQMPSQGHFCGLYPHSGLAGLWAYIYWLNQELHLQVQLTFQRDILVERRHYTWSNTSSPDELTLHLTLTPEQDNKTVRGWTALLHMTRVVLFELILLL